MSQAQHSQQSGPTVFQSLVAGSLSGCAGVLVCHPFDVIRTRVQASNIQKGTADCFRDVLREFGPRGLYAGLLGPFLAQGVYKAVIFTTNTLVSKHIFTGKKTNQTVFLSGAIAGSLNAFIVSPIELLRTRQILSSTQESYSSIFRAVLVEGGVLGLFRGLVPAILRDGLGVGAYFLTFDLTKKLFTSYLAPPAQQQKQQWQQNQQNQQNVSGSLIVKLASGSCAGVAFWAFALPIDTVKTMMESSENMKKGFSHQINDVLSSIRSRGGVRSLFRAWPVAIGRGIPSAAVTLTTFDLASEWLAAKSVEQQ